MPPKDEVAEAIRALILTLDDRHGENLDRLSGTDRKIEEVIRRVDDLHKAFPGGDWEGHRRYHEVLIKKEEEREKFYFDMRSKLAEKGLWAVIGLLAVALWTYVKTRMNT